VGARTDRPDYDYADGVTLRLFEIADGQRTEVRVPAPGGGPGVSFAVTRTGATIRVEAAPTAIGPAKPWRVQVGDAIHSCPPGQRVVEFTW
jgi:alpha-D-xyloside xylohydrolase